MFGLPNNRKERTTTIAHIIPADNEVKSNAKSRAVENMLYQLQGKREKTFRDFMFTGIKDLLIIQEKSYGVERVPNQLQI